MEIRKRTTNWNILPTQSLKLSLQNQLTPMPTPMPTLTKSRWQWTTWNRWRQQQGCSNKRSITRQDSSTKRIRDNGLGQDNNYTWQWRGGGSSGPDYRIGQPEHWHTPSMPTGFQPTAKGYSAWTNPFNGVKNFVSYQNTRFIVFWSKIRNRCYPTSTFLTERNIGCYIQFTLNDYVSEGLEKGVPELPERIETFKSLVNKLGKGHVIWRFDPWCSPTTSPRWPTRK